MRRLDRLIVAELIGPWFFGVMIFTSLVLASTMLVRVSEWVVRGINPATIGEVVLLLLPGIVVKTFAMALLLAALLAFGRLSGDSEITAIRAAGASLYRIMLPVLGFSLAVAVLAFAINETVVPHAAQRATALSTEIRKQLDSGRGARSVMQAIQGRDGIAAMLTAKDFSLANNTLMGVHVVSYGASGQPEFILFADTLRYEGPNDWEIRGRARMVAADGGFEVELKEGAWPAQIARPNFTPQNLLAGFADDLDVFSIAQIRREIELKRRDPFANKRQIANLEFGFWNKFALPLAAVIFALLGAPLGIRRQRAGVGAGFALSVALSFSYLMIVNFLAVYAKSGAISPFLASFAPLFLGAIAAAITIARKNG